MSTCTECSRGQRRREEENGENACQRLAAALSEGIHVDSGPCHCEQSNHCNQTRDAETQGSADQKQLASSMTQRRQCNDPHKTATPRTATAQPARTQSSRQPPAEFAIAYSHIAPSAALWLGRDPLLQRAFPLRKLLHSTQNTASAVSASNFAQPGWREN